MKQLYGNTFKQISHRHDTGKDSAEELTRFDIECLERIKDPPSIPIELIQIELVLIFFVYYLFVYCLFFKLFNLIFR